MNGKTPEQISTKDQEPQADNRAKTGEEMSDKGPTAAQDRVAEEPSGYRGENPATGGPGGGTGIHSATPENARGRIDPSSPGETGTTPGSTPKRVVM